MKKQEAIDRILETENLTDSLEDDDADWLIQWGIDHLDTLLTRTDSDDLSSEKVDHLMAAMGKLNQIVADRAVKPPEHLAHDIHSFLLHYGHILGETSTHRSDKEKLASSQVAPMSPRDTMLYLIKVAEQKE